jgi:outer membrane protein TolC
MRLMGRQFGGRTTRLKSRVVIPFLLVFLCLITGCTRHFFRERADTQADVLVADKASDPQWALINYWVYPHPLSRFADFDNPDCPSMPPDDPAAWLTAPKPQHPEKIGFFEGTGYLEMLDQFDALNRAQAKNSSEPEVAEPPTDSKRKNYVITLDQALELALINSRELQNQRENLFLAALPVTVERFNFLPQFMATQEAIRQWSAQESSFGPTNQWELNSAVGMTQNFTNGAALLLRLANQTVVDLSSAGKPTVSTSSLVFDLSQPLLRGGGRAVALEPLTQAERDLLYEVRRFARTNKEFFVQVAGGSGTPGAPSTPALVSGASISLASAGFVRGQASTVGFLPTLQRKLSIEIQQRNVSDFQNLLQFYREFAKGGAVSTLQVDQVEQQMLDSRTQLLAQQIQYIDTLEQFNIQLGLPTDTPIDPDDAPLRDLREQIFRFEKLELDNRKLIETFSKQEDREDGTGSLRTYLLNLVATANLTQKTNFSENFPQRLANWNTLNSGRTEVGSTASMASVAAAILPGAPVAFAAFQINQGAIPQLLQAQMLRDGLIDQRDNLVDEEKPVPPELEMRITQARRNFELGSLDAILTIYQSRPWLREPVERLRKALQQELFRQIESRFALVVDEARVERQEAYTRLWPQLPPAKLSSKDLLLLDIDAAHDLVSETALANRLDLMNQQAQLVDTWRKVAVFANALLGTFDVRYNATLLAPPPGSVGQAFNFDGNNTRHQLIFNTELPLVRIIERNNYRAALIAYQRQRRNLQAVQDQILLQVRSRVRRLKQFEETYRIQQRGLLLAYSQVNNAFETLQAPPEPGSTRDAASSAASLTQQLVQAQARVPRSQSDLYTTWVSYLIARMELYRDLELMRIDSRGVWIDDIPATLPPPASSP